ncbi:TCR/Tet family MFS transporter [Glacieibacterium sp.]|uniref:TCR/Tet family MFS transporter n=1 Tax=Glacieibacterium sp. TaxID=2860237 RepID=UPI003AFF921B
MTEPRPIRHALAFIFVTVLIDSIGFGIVTPVLPELIMHLTGRDLAGAAPISGYLGVGYAVMQFVFAPLIGGLSDRFGRRPVLLASLAAFSLDYAAMAFAPTIAWLFAARLVAGVTGASFGTAYAYVADVSPPDRRGANFGIIGMGFGLGFIIGPALGGVLAHYGTPVPFMVAAGLALVNVAYGYFVLPESLSPENRRPFDLKRANPIGSVLRIRKYSPAVMTLVMATFLWVVGFQALPVTWNYFTIARFGWSTAQIGYSFAAVGLVAIIMQGGVGRLIIPRVGERRVVIAGGISAIAAYLIYTFAQAGWQMYVGIAVGGLSGLVYQSMQALMSREVGPSEQGELQGAIASIFSIASIIGPLAMTQVFARFVAADAPVYLPGAPFVLAALLSAGMLAVFVGVKVRSAPSGTG